MQNLFFKEKAANSSSSEGLVGNRLQEDNEHFITCEARRAF